MNGLNFAGILNESAPSTVSGQNFVKNYKAYLFSNPCSCGLVNSFISESQKYNFDSGVMTALNSVLSFVNENKISWKLASACESINGNNSSYNYINKLGINQIEKLLEMDETSVVSYLKGGVLRNLMFIPEVRAAVKEVYASTVTETYAPTYKVTTPFSFVIVNESGQYFNVLGKTYVIADGVVSETKVEDPEFNHLNSLVPNFSMIDEALVYSYKPNYASDDYKFTITESSIEFAKGNIKEVFESTDNFLQYADVFSHQLFGRERTDFMNISNNIANVFEHASNIVNIDCAKVVETADNTVFAIVEGKNNVNLNIARSVSAGASSNNFEFMNEALKEVRRVAGVDLNLLYEDRINEDLKAQEPDSYRSIQEQLKASKDAQMDLRKKKIGLLAEEYKNDPVKIALLNNIAKELSILED